MPFSPAKPDASLYGVIPQHYAAKLASSTGDPTADALNQLALMAMSQGGGGLGGYEALIRDANRAGLDATRMEEQGKLATSYINALPNLALRGMSRGVNVDQDLVTLDPEVAAIADAYQLNNTQSQTTQQVGAGVKSLAESGYGVPANVVGGMITNPVEETPVEPTTNYITPEIQAKITTADAAKLKAEADMIDAKNPKKYSNQGDTSTETAYIVKPDGTRVPVSVTVKTKGGGNTTAAPAKATEVRQPKYINKNGKLVPNPEYKGP